ALIERHHGSVYRHALWLVGDADLAADLVQETYYEAWKSLRRLGAPRNGLGWLLTILRRRAAGHFEDRGRRPEALSQQLAETLPQADPDLDTLVDLGKALQRLGLDQRDLLLRRALHGFSYKDLASQMDIPLGTVMSRLARARQALEEDMDRADSGELVPLNRGQGSRGR
ncbi:MAG: RNA polymerase sigma factor, partial [Thiohalorhabdaceae bacterium]